MAVARTLALLLLVEEEEKENGKYGAARECWIRPWLAKRQQFGS